MGSPQSYDPGNKSEGLAQIDFRNFLKHFFKYFFFLQCFFRFPIYIDILISCHRSHV